MVHDRRKWDFFIAHAGADKPAAEELYTLLAPHAQAFLDSRCLLLGDDWDTELAMAQRQSIITVVLISSNTEQAYYQREEIAAAIALARENSNQHRVIPVYLDEESTTNATIPYGLRLKHGLRLSEGLRLSDVSTELLELLPKIARLDDETADRQQGPAAARTYQHRPRSLSFNVSIIDQEDGNWYGEADTRLHYTVERTRDKLTISRSMGYLAKLKAGGPIQPLDYNWVPFEWDFPTLDFKVVNNSNETVFLTDVVFDIAESRLDPYPILIIEPDSYRGNALHFLLINEGWGGVKDLVARFHLTPLGHADTDPRFSKEYPHEITVGDFDEAFNVDITTAFQDAGVDFNGLQSLGHWRMREGNVVTLSDRSGKEIKMSIREYEGKRTSCLGPFSEGGAVVSGELEFRGTTIEGALESSVVKFSTVVWLFDEHLVGAPAPPTYEYTTKFRVDGTNYQQHVSVSHVLKPGDADRFTVKVGMDKSSRHQFRARLLYNDHEEVASQHIDMLAFIPRSGMVYLKGKAESN